MKTCNSTQAESALTINELKDAFFFTQDKQKSMTRLVLMLLKIALVRY